MMGFNIFPLTFKVVVPGLSDPFPFRHIIHLRVGTKTFKQPENFRVSRFAHNLVIHGVGMGIRFNDLMDLVGRIIQVTKHNGTCRARGGACGLILHLFYFTVFNHGLFPGQLIPVVAKGAFLNHTAHTRGHIRAQVIFHTLGPFGIPPVKVPGMIRACPHAVPATKATGIDLADNTCIITIVGCRGRADGYAGRMSMITDSATVLAGTGQINYFSFRKGLSIGQFIHPHPGDAVLFVGFILLKRNVILGHARDHAGTASRALVQINNHSELMGFFIFYHQNLLKRFLKTVYALEREALIPKAASSPEPGSMTGPIRSLTLTPLPAT
jgi:hypothetical protein